MRKDHLCDNNFEKCVLCGKYVNIQKERYIGLRKYYIAGAGQLCDECFNSLYTCDPPENKVDENYFKNQIDKYSNHISYKPKYGYEFFKRALDILFCLIVAIPAFFTTIILSIAIVLDSPGNPFFSQIRVGKNGKFIKIYKLRSMRVDAESYGQKWAEKDDPRITKVGRVLRKYRLDEIPQFLDVFLGKMSLIGPRPEVPALTKKFNDQYPGFVTRLIVTPGLSGLAQVHGGYDLSPHEKLKKDIEYIENRGFKMYFHIFFMTVKTITTGEGAR